MSRVGLLILLTFSTVLGQTGQNAKSLSDLGDKAFGRGAFDEAALKYQAALKINPEDAHILFKLGVTLLSTNRKYEALDPLVQSHKLKHDVSPEIDYYIGHAYQVRLQFKEALDHFSKFKKRHKKLSAIADNKIEESQLGDSLIKRPVATAVELLGQPINSKYNDFAPLLDSGETTLVFTTARDTTQRDIRNNNQIFESIMYSEKLGGVWTEPKPMGDEINHKAHDAATYLSPDGSSMILYYGDTRDLFQSRFSSGKKTQLIEGIWTKAAPLAEPINSISWESSGCLSPDGQFLFFASDRAGGYGDLDIYMSKLELDGTWGKPVNLGPEVNTPANEDAPFMHGDGTLYFGSEGHRGLGNYDIYRTRFKNNRWQKPENLGYPVNTPEYDNYFHLSPNKLHGYFTSVRQGGVGNTDIYMATFPRTFDIDTKSLAIKLRADSIARADSLMLIARKNVKVPDSVLAKNAGKADSLMKSSYVDPSIKAEFHVATEFRGKVIDEMDGKPLHAQIVLVDNKTNKLLTRAYTNPRNGVFIIIIPHGGNYGVSASCDGYLFTSMNFDVPAFAESQTLETAIIMTKAQVGAKSILKNIFFDSGKSNFRQESLGELDMIVNLLKTNSRLRVQINGHTDSFGDNATNKALSLKRAQSVVDYLIKQGIDTSRLKAVGYGEEKPVVSNDDEQEGREINRRTEIEVVEVTQP
jgi:outer membrane protein OmpA-like peptidoglycan-associated protein/tetratricopeptide (TPR) repeat protein